MKKEILLGIIVLLVIISIGSVMSHSQQIGNFSKNNTRAGFSTVQVSQNSPEANEIFISRGGDGVFYMGWNDYRSVSWSNGYVHLGFSYSTDGGHTWATNQVLGNDSDNDFHDAAGDPVVVGGDGNNVYYVLMEFNSSENNLKHSQLVVKKSIDHGQTWSDEARIWPYDVDKPWAVYYNGNLYVAWDNVSSGNMEFTHTIGGNIHQWAPFKAISSTSYPGMAINETGTIFLVGVYSGGWSYSMYVYKSTDGGNTFTSYNLGSISSNAWESNPRSGPIPEMAARGENVYAVWVDNQSYSQVYLAESHDGGNTWSTKEVGDLTGSNYRYMYPSVSISPNGLVHIEYYRMVDSTKHIDVIYRNYTYQTGQFSSEQIIDSWTNSHSFIGDYSTIIADDWGNVSIGYTTENPGDNAMFATYSIPITMEITNSSNNGYVNGGDKLNVSAHITSASSIINATLYYRFEGDTNYSNISMSRISGSEYNGTWNATIDTTGHTGKIYFYVDTDDGRGKEAVSNKNYVIINAVPEFYLPLIAIAPVILFLTRKLKN